MSLSVIVPTMGRSTLDRALASVSIHLKHGDELIVLRDDTDDSGNTPRDKAISIAKGDHLWFLDDDDVATAGAIPALREQSSRHPFGLVLFRMLYGKGHPEKGRFLWERRVVEPGNLGTPCALVPNRPDLPLWTAANNELIFSDIRWIERVAQIVPEVVWDERIVALIRP